jgi:hypothetical protein
MTPTIRFVLVFLLIVSTTVLLAQERHLSNDSASTLYLDSAFAHGYIHGYEDGFHYGDLDLQLGREPRDASIIPSYKHPNAGYESNFGPKESYKNGFKSGFRAGYSDATHEIAFRAIVNLRQAAEGLERESHADAQVFDNGFRDGYDHGRHQGAEDGRASAVSNPINPPCLGLPENYCSGFARGFAVGYSDGYGNQSKRPVSVEASAK